MNIFQYLILNKKDYFSLAEEYIGLQTTFQKESILEKLSLIVDMLIYPLINICMIVFYKQEISLFTVMSIHKTVSLWINWTRYIELTYEINEWKKIVNYVNGPFISCNDPKYHAYVYADTLQRLHNMFYNQKLSTRLTTFTKKGTKSL
jgi:hypothetical protein